MEDFSIDVAPYNPLTASRRVLKVAPIPEEDENAGDNESIDGRSTRREGRDSKNEGHDARSNATNSSREMSPEGTHTAAGFDFLTNIEPLGIAGATSDNFPVWFRPLYDEGFRIRTDEMVLEEKSAFLNEYSYCIVFANDAFKPGDSKTQLSQKSRRRKNRKAIERALVQVGLEIRKAMHYNTKYLFYAIKASHESVLEKEAEAIEMEKKLRPSENSQHEKHQLGYSRYVRVKRNMFEWVQGSPPYEFPRCRIFNTMERQRLVLSLLQRKAALNLEGELHRNAIAGYFPFHTNFASRIREDGTEEQTLRLQLQNKWVKPLKGSWNQPLQLIRDYFGEKLALYFAFRGHLSKSILILTIAGLLAFIAAPQADGRSTIAFAGFVSVWSSFVLEYWKQQNSRLSWEWNTLNFATKEPTRVDYMRLCYQMEVPVQKGFHTSAGFVALEEEVEDDDGRVYMRTLTSDPAPPCEFEFPKEMRIARYMAGYFVLMMCCGLSVLVTYILLALRAFVMLSSPPGAPSYLAGVLIGFLFGIYIYIFSTAFRRVAVALTTWENHRTDSDYEQSLVLKQFLFDFVSSFTGVTYIAFGKLVSDYLEILGVLSNVCAVGANCILDVQSQLFGQFACSVMLHAGSSQLQKLGAWIRRALGKSVKNSARVTTRKNLSKGEEEFSMAVFSGIDYEFSVFTVQFAYITLFSAAFPFGPVFFLFANVFSIRSLSNALIYHTQRPHYAGASDLGIWMYIFHFLSMLGIFVNALLIGFTSNYLRDVAKLELSMRVWIVILTQDILIVVKLALHVLIKKTPGSLSRVMAIEDFEKKYILSTHDKLRQLRMRKFNTKAHVVSALVGESETGGISSVSSNPSSASPDGLEEVTNPF